MTLFKARYPLFACVPSPHAVRTVAASVAFLGVCATMSGQSAADLFSQAQKLYEEGDRYSASPLVQNDPKLKIQALALLGIIDLNIDTAAAGADWKQVLDTATAANDPEWQNRARGELGIVAGMKGDIGAAGMALFKAIDTAEQIGDVGAAINFRTWLAN